MQKAESHTKRSKKLIVAANRLPVSISPARDSQYQYQRSPGGLVSALSSLDDSTWVGWPGIMDPETVDQDLIRKDLAQKYHAHPIFLSRRQIDRYYYGFSNRVLWPVLHYLPDYTLYEERDYLAYRDVNEIFAREIVRLLEKEEAQTLSQTSKRKQQESSSYSNVMIWIQDYQLMLLPRILRAMLPHAHIGFFLHTPFPSSEMFRTLPYREELLQGLLGSSLIGFHTFNYQRHFSSSVLHILGREVEFSRIKLDTHTLRMGTFPIGIDVKGIQRQLKSSGAVLERERRIIHNITKGRRMILSVDRLDYTKGIPDRLRAYRKFLHKNPKMLQEVVLIQIAVPSRTAIRDYQALKYTVEEIVSQLEEDFEYEAMLPIRFLYRSLPFERLAVYYQEADVALVTPYFDGMNLVAKEYVAVKKNKGVLVLSERAGAAYELGEALLINPWNSDQISGAIQKALLMKPEEQKMRMEAMYEKILRSDVHYWSSSFLEELQKHHEEETEEITLLLREDLQKNILASFQKASRRLLLLDYDGTLSPITNFPGDAAPDQELLDLLKNLSEMADTDVAIVTGRKRDDICSWLGDLNLVFSTEHGLRIKWPHEKQWFLSASLQNNYPWYQEVKEVLEHYNRTTPGSFMESKEASLSWHHRMVDPTLGKWKANELQIHLQNALANHPLEVVSGKMVVEVRLQGVNKGNIFRRSMQMGNKYDFILAIGDDTTDEYMFAAMPLYGIGIKVGKLTTRAQYHLESVQEVRNFLQCFVTV